jgi:hypothetical protein
MNLYIVNSIVSSSRNFDHRREKAKVFYEQESQNIIDGELLSVEEQKEIFYSRKMKNGDAICVHGIFIVMYNGQMASENLPIVSDCYIPSRWSNLNLFRAFIPGRICSRLKNNKLRIGKWRFKNKLRENTIFL